MATPDEWSIRFVPISKPQLLVAQNSEHPELPSLPYSELVLSPSSNFRGYCGEEFHGLVVATNSGLKELNSSNLGALPENIHLSVQVQSETDAVKSYPSTSHRISPEQPFATSAVSFPLKSAGKWQIRALLQIDHALETQRVVRTFDIDVSPAVRILFKVSRGSPSLGAHVLEAQVENCSDSILCIESCELTPRNGWHVESINGTQPLPSPVILRPHEIHQFCFLLRDGRSAEAAVLVVGWRREPVGSKGWQTTRAVRI